MHQAQIDFILESNQWFYHGNGSANSDYFEWNDLFTPVSKFFESDEYSTVH